MKELTRAEFNELAQKNNWEVFTQRQVYQFSQDILKSVDPIEREHGAIDFVSLNRQEIRNDDLTKSVVYWREQQVDWDKAENGTIMKARSGVYKDTPVNRKKGVVGMKYGQEKKGDEGHSEDSKKETSGMLKKENVLSHLERKFKRGDKVLTASLGNGGSGENIVSSSEEGKSLIEELKGYKFDGKVEDPSDDIKESRLYPKDRASVYQFSDGDYKVQVCM